MQQLERHAFKRLGELPVDRIGREDVLAVLTPIWAVKPETARRIRRHIRATLKWCQAHGRVQFNAAGEAIDGALPRMPAVRAHLRALSYREVSEALDTVDASTATPTAKLALRFLVLTASRPGEVRGATWEEIDIGERVWRIPGERMKGGVRRRCRQEGGGAAWIGRGCTTLVRDAYHRFLRNAEPAIFARVEKSLRDRAAVYIA